MTAGNGLDTGAGVAPDIGLVTLARTESPGVVVTAQTLPVRNISNRILEKLGFRLAGTAVDAEAGEVWEWHLDRNDA